MRTFILAVVMSATLVVAAGADQGALLLDVRDGVVEVKLDSNGQQLELQATELQLSAIGDALPFSRVRIDLSEDAELESVVPEYDDGEGGAVTGFVTMIGDTWFELLSTHGFYRFKPRWIPAEGDSPGHFDRAGVGELDWVRMASITTVSWVQSGWLCVLFVE
jgi:hypothetical protein